MKALSVTLCSLFAAVSLARAADDCEFNDTSAYAVPVSPGPCIRVTGWVEFTGDNDFFAFSAAAGEKAWISTRTSSSSPSYDTLLYLYGPDGAMVESDDDDGDSYNSLIAAAPLDSDGTYTVQVHEYGNNALAYYTVYFTVMGDDVREIEDGSTNDVYTDAQEVSLNGWVLGTLGAQTDVDFYKVWVDSYAENVDVAVMLSDDPYRDGLAGEWNAVLTYYYLSGVLTELEESSHEGTGPDEPEDLYVHSTSTHAGWQYLRISNTAASITQPAYYAVSIARVMDHVCVETPSPFPTPSTTPPPTRTPVPSATPSRPPLPTASPTVRIATPTPRPTLIPPASPSPTPSARPPPFPIDIQDDYFEPAFIRLPINTPVAWNNKGSTVHTVTCDFGPQTWHSGPIDPGDDYGKFFRIPGSYYYRSVPDTGMNGRLLIGDATPTPAPTPIPSPTPTCGPILPIPDFEIAEGDYDGDGDADVAVFRPSAGLWAARDITRIYFGASGDRPVCGDHDGDADSDLGLFKPSTGLWFVPGVTRFNMGNPSDFAVPRDYLGDGTVDCAVFRGSSGMWRIRDITTLFYGSAGDHPVPAFYSGALIPEIALYRPSEGMWAVSGFTRIYFGGDEDWPLPADYDGDGTAEAAIFRPDGGLWAIYNLTRFYYGCCTDYPLPADYDGNGTADIGLFRDSATLWAVRDITRAYFGMTGDIPVTK